MDVYSDQRKTEGTEAIGMNDLVNEEIVSVVTSGDQTKKRVSASYVFAKPFHVSFAAQVKGARISALFRTKH